MKKDNYKPQNNRNSGTFNIKYCSNCKKYQHFKRYFKHEITYDICSICGYRLVK